MAALVGIRLRFLLCLIACLISSNSVRAGELELLHVVVNYSGIDEQHARSVARTVEVARAICSEKHGFEMPDTIRVNISAKPGQAVRLFNDGVDTFTLSLRSEADLRKPTASGTFHLYGLCHEVAHLAMYRPIKDHSWLSTAGAEGWAHYMGSVIVDEVYAKEGPGLWPDAYDYRTDGTNRLDEQLSKPNVPEVARGARLWRDLAKVIGPEKIPLLFAAWGQAKIDPADPVTSLKEGQQKVVGDARLDSWWDEAGSLLFERHEASRIARRQIESSKLTGSPRVLSHDDGTQAGKSSIAGGGHAVRFSVPDGSAYLTAVEIYGARYGSPKAPNEEFRVWLCDEQFRAIAEFKMPYAKFERGEPKWVKLRLDPTNVPSKFIVCVEFNPAATKGVYVHYDGKDGVNSLTGLPGSEPRAFTKGNWMIRASVDQTKETDALAPIK